MDSVGIMREKLGAGVVEAIKLSPHLHLATHKAKNALYAHSLLTSSINSGGDALCRGLSSNHL